MEMHFMGMAWYKFYIYIYLPLGIIGFILGLKNISFNFYSFYFKAVSYPPAIPGFLFVSVAVITIILNIILIFGLHFKKLWAWNLNLFSLALFTVVGNLYTFKNLHTYLCGVLIYVALWLIPNYTYFKRRKVMFN
jgi:hypothetical protein